MSIAAETQKRSRFQFCEFTLDLDRRGLYRGSERVRLTSKPLETLIFLVENRGRVVQKQELLDSVWKDTFVTEDTLVHSIREIRRALEDDKENPRFVQTVPRRGYRFVCEVSEHPGGQLAAEIAENAVVPSDSAARPIGKIIRWPWIGVPILAISLILGWIFWPRVWNREIRLEHFGTHTGGINKQITTGEFSSGKPAFSGDGRFILYVSSSEETRGHSDLFIRQFPDGTPLRITNEINPSGDLPVFTADGNQIVFSLPRMDQAGLRHHDLWKVPSFGGPPERFIEDASGAGFSPDQKWVAYTKRLPSRDALWVGPVGAATGHFEMSIAGYTPRWSPNGEWLAYSTSDPNGGVGDIWICKASTADDGRGPFSHRKQLTNEQKQIYGLTWSADNRSIVFASRRTGSAQLYQVSIADGSITPLLKGVGEYEAPSASPDGRTVIFHNKRVVNDLTLATLGETCEAKNLTFNQFHLWPRISPSGEKLVSVLRQIDNTERLYLTDIKTKKSSQLGDRDAHHPCWLDEETVAFLSLDTSYESTEALLVNINAREIRRLTIFSGAASWLTIHPDKNRVAVVLKSTDGKERVLVRDLRNEVDETIHAGSEYEYLRWSVDGSALCWDRPGVSRNAPNVSNGIWMIEIGKSEPRFIAAGGYCPVWDQDGGAVYFTIRDGPRGLWRHDVRQNKDRQVCRWGQVFHFDIVGKRLVFAQHRNDTQVYSISLNQ